MAQYDNKAMLKLGDLYGKGCGVQQDYKEALKWYMKAAELCNVEAIIKLGTTYEEGLGVEKNYGEAYRWYQRAAGFFGSGAEDQLKDLLEKKFGPELLQKSGADVFMDFQCN